MPPSQPALSHHPAEFRPSIWVRSIEVLPDVTNIMFTGLQGAGFDAQRWDSGSMPPLEAPGGIVIFGSLSPRVFDFVQKYGRVGGGRIIAVSTMRLSGREAWQVVEAGASDVFTWDQLANPVAVIGKRLQRWLEVDELVNSPLVRDNLIGESQVWKSTLRRIVEMSRYSDAFILLMGDSGTGKELLAKVIHQLDRRAPKGDFALLDCTTVVPELSGSEFFGHERGAFTNAVSARDGVFAAADAGTLFLDEVGELPLQLQAALLRVIQERMYKPVGSNVWKRVDFRLICATNRDLEQEEARGRFRRDFYYRIAGIICRVPPLSERREDIPLLVNHFLRALCPGPTVPELDAFVQDYLRVRDYPGNIRELRHLVARIAGRYIGEGPITVGNIPEDERPKVGEFLSEDWRRYLKVAIRHAMLRGATLREIGKGASEAAIEAAINDEAGNLQRAARRLGVTGRALQMRRAASREADAEDNTVQTEPGVEERCEGSGNSDKNVPSGLGARADQI